MAGALSDVLAAVAAAGFRPAPAWPAATAAIPMAAVAGYWIRLDPTLNIIMPIHPVGASDRRQAGS